MEMAPAMVATTVIISVSRLPTCAISWASTALNSSRFRMRRMPLVTATAGCLGLRPVAKALGEVGVDFVHLGHRQAGQFRLLADDAV